MKNVAFATALGGVLGIFDGMTAWFTPEVRNQMVGIIIGSTVKGVVTGVLIGLFAKWVQSLVWGMLFGLAVGAFFAYLILLGNPGHALNIMLPGSLVGLIVGYAAQKHRAAEPVVRGAGLSRPPIAGRP
jgi:hypothetical protein